MDLDNLIISKTEDTALIHALTQAAFAEYGRELGTSTALKETEEAIAAQFAGGMQALVVYLSPTSPPTPSPGRSYLTGKGEPDSGSLLSQRRMSARERRVGEERLPLASVRYQIEGDALYFHRLSVHPDYRRQGRAKKLIGHLEALARAQGLARLTCSVRLQKTDNIALYTGLGFQLLGERSVCRDGTPVATGDFEKRLG
ncbi:GNAT family N-acetyltransferase [Armatimonas sp.]|uniref:GNAT family N-acetyltransferase n=1 Tax=Armatimonas sp. TaxID=1872638 RepID=UPI00286B9B2F|nr:GNAT family N-acetyltransferase [Armatimonas sp.]